MCFSDHYQVLYFNKLHKYSDCSPGSKIFAIISWRPQALCWPHCEKAQNLPWPERVFTCFDTGPRANWLLPLMPSFSSRNSTYGEGVTHWDNHGVTNNSLLCPCGLGKLVNSAKEVNCDKETYKYSSKQAWDLGWENPHCKHHHSPGKDFQMLVTCSNTASSSWGSPKSLITGPRQILWG